VIRETGAREALCIARNVESQSFRLDELGLYDVERRTSAMPNSLISMAANAICSRKSHPWTDEYVSVTRARHFFFTFFTHFFHGVSAEYDESALERLEGVASVVGAVVG
jgi:hypothetical protein